MNFPSIHREGARGGLDDEFRQETKTDIFDYIEIFYNQQRRHF